MTRRLPATSCLVALLVVAIGCADPYDADTAAGAGGLTADLGPVTLNAARDGRSFIVLLAPSMEADADDALPDVVAGAVHRFQFVPARLVEVASPADVDNLRRLPGVVGVYPNRVVSVGPLGKPSTGGGTTAAEVLPEGVKRVKANQAWAITTGAGVGVAIADTGIDPLHQDLTVGSSCFSAYGSCDDGHGHGTHVAGIVAAKDNTVDVVGVAPAATVYAVRVLDASGSGTDAAIMDGLEWVLANKDAVTPPIRVVNMSLGRDGTADDNPALRLSVQNLVAAGVTVVVAAGNTVSKEIGQQVPSSYPEVIAVASTTAKAGAAPTKGSCRGRFVPADTASYFTSDGVGALTAPGEEAENISSSCFLNSVGILSTRKGGGTERKSGTSMASPTVAGVAALLLAQDSTRLPDAIRSILGASSACQGTVPKDGVTSSYTFDGVREGVVDALAALSAAAPTCP